MAKPTASFNARDLASSVDGLIIIATDPYRVPDRIVTNAPLANSNKSVTNAAWFTSKKLNVKVEIGRNTRELFEASLDQLTAILQTKEAALVLSYGSTTRQWTATYRNMAISDLEGGHGTIDIEFLCSDPYGYEVSSTNLFSSTRSGSSSTDLFTVGGSAEWQVPVITITFNSLTGGTLKDVVVGNSASGQQLTITNTFTSGDILIIDSRNKIITLNGQEIRGVGAIPEWGVGAGSLDYSDTLTTRNVTVTASYYKRYL